MPFLKRFIEPKYVSRNVVPRNISNELDYMSNSTLASIMYQLSSLSRHSEDLFGELHRETSIIMYRTSQLNERIENLKGKIVRLNPVVEEVLLQDINMRKPFKSSIIKEQQIISAHSRPQAISEVYALVDPPPPLRILNAYREDRKDSMKFYTDPGYFFELWSQEITKNAETQFKKHRLRKGRAVQRPTEEPPPPVRQPKCHHEDVKHGHREAEFAGSLPRGNHATPLYSSPGRQAQTISVLKIQKDSFGIRNEDLEFQGDDKYTPRSASSRNSASHFVFPSIRHEKKLGRSESERVQSLAYGISREEKRGNVQAVPQGGVVGHVHPGSSIASYDDQQLSQVSAHQGKGLHVEGYSPRHCAGQSVTSVNAEKNFGFSRQSPAPPDSSLELLQQQQQLPQQEDSPKCRSRDSLELPLPPTPPMELQSCYYPMPSPPPIPSPVPDYQQNLSLPGSPILPPPLYEANLASKGNLPMEYAVMLQKHFHPNDHLQFSPGALSKEEVTDPDVVSVDADDPNDPNHGHRSDLLAAIKKGIQLRKVEERRLKTVQRQQTKVKGHLDVQSIMEAAFEMRRKALDENDSDDDDDELDNNWSDEN